MHFEEDLQKGQSKAKTSRIVRHVGTDAARFALLMKVLLKDNEQLMQRASWPVSEIALLHPTLLKPYYSSIIALLEKPGTAAPFKRHFLRVFAAHGIPEKWEGRLLNCCMAWIPSEQEAIAVRAFSISAATRICCKYPELQNELLILLEVVLEMPVSGAIQVRIKRAIKDVKSARASV
ncbi:MAG: hypothetical protein EBU33_01195 [Sphingobacteriia bacterium]|jgi:hypothetical protein|nr:hypothetical protein [Sphingobacteriia bacterium]